MPQAVGESSPNADEDMILGINPDQAGEVIDRSETPEAAVKRLFDWQTHIRLAQIVLALLAVGGGLTLLILHLRRTF